MPELRLLHPDDHETFAGIITLSNDFLRPTLGQGGQMYEASPRTPYGDWYATMGHCVEVSDAVTRAAHTLGIIASREWLAGFHFITSFAPLDQLPSEHDLILDRTWGQYNPHAYSQLLRPFFGRRRDMASLVPPEDYAKSFAAASIKNRQIAHRPIRYRLGIYHSWLNTTPQEVATGGYKMGTAGANDYPDDTWV